MELVLQQAYGLGIVPFSQDEGEKASLGSINGRGVSLSVPELIPLFAGFGVNVSNVLVK